jgi:hypothetical protein
VSGLARKRWSATHLSVGLKVAVIGANRHTIGEHLAGFYGRLAERASQCIARCALAPVV